jgi:predicted RNase H-like nuclease (RuvC/YqgF family)
MTATKDQERKALAQIRKIVEGLGEDSYIGMAFEGCFELAEENIENDFALSMKDRADAAERRKTALEHELMSKDVEIETLNDYIEGWKHKCERLQGELEAERKENKRLQFDLDSADVDKIAHLEQEIIILKAKLYDMIVKE